MESYVDRYRAQEAARALLPRREYLTNEEFRKQKAALTRAKNSGEGVKVLRAVEAAVEVWNGKVWPDDWARWRNALDDAAWKADREGDYDLGAELHAAGMVLFR